MSYFEETFSVKTNSTSDEKYIIRESCVRVSVLTSRLIRVETQPDGKFCDFPTQSVLNRSFADTDYSYTKHGKELTVKTDDATFILDCENGRIKKVILKDGMEAVNFKSGNLKGTRRTLDMTFGKAKIGDGIISKSGVALMDDSETLILCSDGLVKPRKEILGRDKNGKDIYCFAYGHDYMKAIADYYHLTGETPLIPRYALGNWWSRYKAYTQEEYLSLMQSFIDRKIPVTVATVDMDWHWTDVKSRFGNEAANYKKPKSLFTRLTGCYEIPGWTGYSWNTELFPDYKGFLNKLHENNYKVTLNVHPAVGVRSFEDCYNKFAEFMGIDPESGKQIEFDITDKKFIEGYFRFLHHGYENDGVDFWWIDWQQEKYTKVDGLDPLWAVNHYHSLDSKRNGKRPLILSRFAGYGSHRYPLGFSGDTAVNWKCLDFQPYFTATASNVGYSWWSHDIGGHHFGKRDDELYIRWLQFGVFSPIMRLHSANNEFLGKEPWKFSSSTEHIAENLLRLRHRMIPYIYSMNRLTQENGLPLVRPMYYEYPENSDAYSVGNEYFFGTQLIVAPITRKTSEKTNMAFTDVWLPDGKFTDVFTGRVYNGGSKFRMYRDTWSVPVLAREGAIIPLSSDGYSNNWSNPDNMEILVYSGNGKFSLYEDDGETENYKSGEYAQTAFEQEKSGDSIKFIIQSAQGDLSVLPAKRSYVLAFKDILSAGQVIVTKDSESCDFGTEDNNGYLSVIIDDVLPENKISVELKNIVSKANPPKEQMMAELISKIQGNNDLKVLRFTKCLNKDFNGEILASKEIKGAINEIMHMS